MSDLDKDVTKQRFGGSRAGPGLAAWPENFSSRSIRKENAEPRGFFPKILVFGCFSCLQEHHPKGRFFFCGSAREISYKICVSAQIAQLSIFSERYFWMQGTVCVLRLQLLLCSRRFSLHWMSLSERRIDSSKEILPE